LPTRTVGGPSYVDAKKCRPEDIAAAMLEVAEDKTMRRDMAILGRKRAEEWLAGVSDINDLLDKACLVETITVIDKVDDNKIDAVLFVQHSAAGDVFMTTRCFKGIKERYGLPLHYMTQSKYSDILVNNPYIDEIIPWDESVKYRFVVNPHGERIAPGHWGRNCNSILSDFYWKILNVEPDDFYIELKQPKFDDDFDKNWAERIAYANENNAHVIEGSPALDIKPIAILHTTGGDSHFRIYKYMKDVHEGIKDRYTTIQLGGPSDYPAWADIDLRGKLTFRETAWIMSKASIAVTVDSFISHLAGALGVSQVCLFGSGNYVVVKPNQVSGKLICLSPDYVNECKGLGPCSGVVKECAAPCTGLHDPKDILKSIEEIENG